MTKEEEKRFDSQIRSVLGDAREDVPEGLWLGIEQRLSACESISDNGNTGRESHAMKRRTVPLWIRISSGIAAAAAIAVALFVSGTFDGTISGDPYDSLADTRITEGVNIAYRNETPARAAGLSGISETVAEAVVPEEKVREEVRDMNETAPTYPASASDAADLAGSWHEGTDGTDHPGYHGIEDGGPAQENETADIAAGSEPTGEDVLTDNGRTGTDLSDSEEALWKELMAEDKKQGIRTSITLSGNAISNTNSAVNRQASAPISYRPNKNTPKKDVVSESGESSYSVPVSVGIGVKIDFTERWALGVGVNYSHLGRTFAGTFFDYEDGVLVSDNTYSNILNRQDYIGIPVNAYFSILKNNFIDFYAYAGGSIEKCLSNKFLMTADGAGIRHSEPVKGCQFSANIGLGMEFIIADTFGIYLDPSLRYYFPDSRQPRSIRTDQPLMLGLELGFRIRL